MKRDQREAKNQAQSLESRSMTRFEQTGTFNLIGTPYSAKTPGQKLLAQFIKDRNIRIVFARGLAGTGKTYTAMSLAIEALSRGEYQKIVMTRPAVEAAGEKLGFLPGEVENKFGPYLVPLQEIMKERVPQGMVDMLAKQNRFEGLPLAFMRGRTFKFAAVILDEAQNCTPEQMLMVMTRLGEGSKLFVCGDEQQTDIKGLLGLIDAVEKVGNLGSVGVVDFRDKNEVVRDKIVSDILGCYGQ